MVSSLPSDSTVSIQVGKLQWYSLSGYHNRLFGPHAPDWSELERQSQAKLIKANPLRRVYHIRINELDLYAKVYQPASWRDHVKWYMSTSPSQKEFIHLQTARARAVPAAKPLAWARSKASAKPQAVLITESIGVTVSLLEIIEKKPLIYKNLRKNCLIAAAGLVAHLHCAGIQHRDLHAGNILLVRGESYPKPNEISAYISDLQNVHIEQRGGHASADPNRSWRSANLAMLCVGLRIRLEKDELNNFIRAYLQAMQPRRKWSENEIEEFHRKLHRLADRHERKLWTSRDRRALQDSKYSQKVKLPSGWSARVYLENKGAVAHSPASKLQFTQGQWQAALSEPLDLIQPGELLKKGGHNTVVARNLSMGNAELQVVAKHNRLYSGWRGYWQALRRSRALRHWLRAWMFIHRRLPTAWPLAAIERRQNLLLRESILLCERIPNSLSLRQMIRQNALPETPAQRRQLTEQIGRLLAELRLKGFRHRDCKANNILIRHQPEQEPAYQCYLIDLDGLQQRRLPIAWSGHEALIRLGASVIMESNLNRSDFARLFKYYLGSLKLPETNDRILRHRLWNKLSNKIQTHERKRTKLKRETR